MEYDYIVHPKAFRNCDLDCSLHFMPSIVVLPRLGSALASDLKLVRIIPTVKYSPNSDCSRDFAHKNPFGVVKSLPGNPSPV